MTLVLPDFIKNKLFSTTGIFLLIFAAIISIFLFSNSNVILSKFGFETTTTLKSELTRTQDELRQLKSINDSLVNDIKAMELKYKKQLETINTLQKEKIAVEKKLTGITKTYNTTKNKLNKDVEIKVNETPTEITIPIQEINQLSSNNIDTLNQTYSQLFEN